MADRILAFVKRQGRVTINQVAEVLSLHPSTARKILYRLFDKGCVAKSTNRGFIKPIHWLYVGEPPKERNSNGN